MIISKSEFLNNNKQKNQNRDVKNTVQAKGIAALHIINMAFDAPHLENKQDDPPYFAFLEKIGSLPPCMATLKKFVPENIFFVNVLKYIQEPILTWVGS